MKYLILKILIQYGMKSDFKKLNVITVVGTRPEIIRLSSVIKKLDKYCNHTLVHTGQNYDYELNEIFFKDLGIRDPDIYLEAAGANAAETIGQIIIAFDKILEKHEPEAILILGDTNSCLSVIPAKRRKIPIFHMEAGNRCFDMRVPEEINRKLVDHISDINLTYSSIARQYLIQEGLSSEMIIKTGSPMKEVLHEQDKKIKESKILDRLNLKQSQYYLVSAHREENIESLNFEKLVKLLNKLADLHNLPIIVSTHPRTKKRIKENSLDLHKNIKLLKPLSFSDYNKLQINSKVVLSDSGTITEESSIQNFAALNIRESHERPEGMEEGAVMMVGLDVERVLQGIRILDDQNLGDKATLKIVEDYDIDNVSDKVVRIITSHVDYVNRTVWKKY